MDESYENMRTKKYTGDMQTVHKLTVPD